MITDGTPKMKLQDSVALRKFSVFAVLFCCILFTLGHLYTLAVANKDYYSAEGMIVSISGPQVSGGYKGPTEYGYTYYCEFTDHKGNLQVGKFRKESKGMYWEYPIRHVMTIYYAEDFMYGGRIYVDRPSKTGGALLGFLVVMWMFELFLIIIYVLQLKKFVRLYGKIPRQVETITQKDKRTK